MATRPIFVPKASQNAGVIEEMIDFKWHAGMASSQKKKSIFELHCAAKVKGINKILEISSKSDHEIGIKLSAFNLLITTKKNMRTFTVETAFQGSKVFQRGGPYKDLFGLDSLAAKKDIRLKESGNLLEFNFFNEIFPLEPRTFFYDWIYINALVQNPELAEEVFNYDGFSDIEFNPAKSINCQAHSVALYVSLQKNDVLNYSLKSSENFLQTLKLHYEHQRRNTVIQTGLL